MGRLAHIPGAAADPARAAPDRPRPAARAVAVGCAALIAGLIAPPARAHVAPALDTNNRYLRIAPMADRVRLAYTVYIGEIPGAQARQEMDADGDGALTDAETAAHRDELAAAVAAALEVTADGAARPARWSEVAIGLGTPATNAGSFSVDLVMWLCLADAAPGAHEMTVRDRFVLPRPGETELMVQESPGVAVLASTSDEGGPSQLEFRWRGAEIPLATRGWSLAFEVSAEAARLAAATRADPADPCHGMGGAGARASRGGGEPAGAGSRRALALGVAAGLALALAGLVFWLRRRAARPPGA